MKGWCLSALKVLLYTVGAAFGGLCILVGIGLLAATPAAAAVVPSNSGPPGPILPSLTSAVTGATNTVTGAASSAANTATGAVTGTASTVAGTAGTATYRNGQHGCQHRDERHDRDRQHRDQRGQPGGPDRSSVFDGLASHPGRLRGQHRDLSRPPAAGNAVTSTVDARPRPRWPAP